MSSMGAALVVKVLEVVGHVTYWKAWSPGQPNTAAHLDLEIPQPFKLQANFHQLLRVSFSFETRYSGFIIYFKLLQLLKMYEHCEIN